jgi:hypothetical protein
MRLKQFACLPSGFALLLETRAHRFELLGADREWR